MSTALWKLEKDLCRCCHAEGSFKHLSEPCFQLGQEEIYADMLQECLNMKINPISGALSDITYTICESCIVRLRDASNFKQQVAACEERFKEMYSKNLLRSGDGSGVKDEPEIDSDADMKVETLDETLEELDEDDDDAFLNFDDDDSDQEELPVEFEAPQAKGKGKAKPKPKPKKAPAKKPKAKAKPVKSETETLTEAAVSSDKRKGAETPKMKPCFNCKKMHALTSLDTAGNCPDCAHPLPRWEVRLLKELLTEGTHAKVTDQAALVNNGRQAVAGHSKDHADSAVNEDEKTNDTSRFDDSDDDSLESLRDTADEAPSVHPCDECSRSFDSALKLANHTKRSHILKCPDCDSSFSTALQLKKHEIKEHGREKTPVREKDSRYDSFLKIVNGADVDKVYACRKCDFRANQAEVLRHIRGHINSLTCPTCDEYFPDEELIDEHKTQPCVPKEVQKSRLYHVLKVIQGKPLKYGCLLCDVESSEDWHRMVAHFNGRHLREMSCPLCDMVFSDVKLLEIHKSQPHPNKTHSCFACKAVFTNSTRLKTHIKTRHVVSKCRYGDCDKIYRSPAELRSHQSECHRDLLPTCGVCGLKGFTQGRINTHQRMVHLKEKNITCRLCNLQFFGHYQLRKHMVSHKVEKLYECKFCKKTFPRLTTCRTHEMIHTGEKKKKCDICNASFVQKASLNYHMMKQHPDRV